MPITPSDKHIRPRKKATVAVNSSHSNDSGIAIEAFAEARPRPATPMPSPATTLPKGILKLPRYSKRSGIVEETQYLKTETASSIVDEKIEEWSSSSKVTQSSDVHAPTLAIEGHTPRVSMAVTREQQTEDLATAAEEMTLDEESHSDESSKPLIFSSVSQLLEAAGNLLAQDDASPAAIEADLSFQCMDAESFKDFQRMKEAEYYEACLGRPLGMGSDVGVGNAMTLYGMETDDTDENTDPSVENDNDLPWSGDDEEEDGEPSESRPPRLFACLFRAISQWVTPQAVDYVRKLRQSQCDNNFSNQQMQQVLVYDKTDLGVSRCAGLQALLKMHCKRCLRDELHQPAMYQRTVEDRLGKLLRCFDYSLPTPQLTTAQTKALCCVLLDVVTKRNEIGDVPMRDDEPKFVPACCQALGMSHDEYFYLKESAIVNFGTPTD